jgi:hypothetical protein
MRNVMLGHTGDGKTTFVASAYTRFQQPISGFTLRTESEPDHDELISLGAKIARGRYPEGTTARAEYRFALRHENTPVLDFTWVDYRGGALMNAASASDTKQILADLREADAIQVFVDAAAIAGGKRVQSQLGRITTLIAEAVGGTERPLPLAVILTKYDLVPPGKATDRLLDPVRGLIGAVSASDRVTGAVFRVAAGPSQQDLERPVLFAMHHCLTAERDRRANGVRNREQLCALLQAEADTWKQREREHDQAIFASLIIGALIQSIFTDTDHFAGSTEAAKNALDRLADAERLRDQAQRERAELDRLMPSVRALSDYLANLETF